MFSKFRILSKKGKYALEAEREELEIILIIILYYEQNHYQDPAILQTYHKYMF